MAIAPQNVGLPAGTGTFNVPAYGYVPPPLTSPVPGAPPAAPQNSGAAPGGSTPTVGLPDAFGVAQATAMANKAYQDALAQINYQRQSTLTSYGYLGDINKKTGVIQNMRVDPNSMYGQLQTMFHDQALEDESAQNAAFDRGLHGGLANQAASNLKYAHMGARTKLGQTLQDTLNTDQQEQNAAAYQRDQAIWQAELDAILAQIQAGNFPSGSSPSSDPGSDPTSNSVYGGGSQSPALSGLVTNPSKAAALKYLGTRLKIS